MEQGKNKGITLKMILSGAAYSLGKTNLSALEQK
jgi:hypothetical protein